MECGPLQTRDAATMTITQTGVASSLGRFPSILDRSAFRLYLPASAVSLLTSPTPIGNHVTPFPETNVSLPGSRWATLITNPAVTPDFPHSVSGAGMQLP